MKHSSSSHESYLSCVKSRILSYVGVLFAFALFASLTAFAQQATLVGTVTDPSGAVIANAKITATNAETSVVHTITTNGAGQYVLPDVRIGHYDVKAEGPGLKIAERKAVVFQLGNGVGVDFQMQVGAAAGAVAVEGTAVRTRPVSGDRRK